MKATASRLFLLLALLVACRPEYSAPAPATPVPLSGAGPDPAVFVPGLAPSQRGAPETLEGATRYTLDYTIDEDLVTVTGRQATRYTNREQATLDELAVRLLPNALNGEMRLTGSTRDGLPVQGRLGLDDSLLTVPLDPPLPPGAVTDLGFSFTIALPTEPASNYGILASYDGVLTLAHCYAMIAVYDDEGWNAEIPPEQGDPTYADASFFVVTVDAPVELTMAASGHEIAREDRGERQSVTFAAGPARDFYLAASAEYQVVSETIDGVTFNSYARAGSLEGARAALEYAAAAVEVFGERYAPYPYSEFDLVATPTYALGVEYPGIVAITDRLYDLEGSLSGKPNRALLESVVVHEAGHQWFYNLVGNDQLDEPWLDESLTQFVTWQYYLDRYGAGGARGFEQSLSGRWARVEERPVPIGLPVAAYEGAEYSAIVYGRGAFFFDALRERMGAEPFDRFLSDYTQIHAWGIASGESLLAEAERACDCELDDLYAAWVLP